MVETMVRELVSHQCGLGLIPGHGIICRSSLLLGLILDVRVFLWFSSLHKNQHFQITIQSGISRATGLTVKDC